MKVTLKDLFFSRQTLSKLAGMSFKAKTSYKLMKMIDQINHELEPFNKVRMELFEKYGEKEGDSLTIKPENQELFKSEMEELEKQEVELKFTITLDEIENAELTASELYDLHYLFDDVATPQ